jgi:hypothetical protein
MNEVFIFELNFHSISYAIHFWTHVYFNIFSFNLKDSLLMFVKALLNLKALLILPLSHFKRKIGLNAKPRMK